MILLSRIYKKMSTFIRIKNSKLSHFQVNHNNKKKIIFPPKKKKNSYKFDFLY